MTDIATPFSNVQPYLTLTEAMPLYGIYPSAGSGSAYWDTLGFVYDFAGNFAPNGSEALQGQLLAISANSVVYNLLGTTYGGDGTQNFLLPNLAGEATIGEGTGNGLPAVQLGGGYGAAGIQLNLSEIPAGTTPPDGGGQPFDNVQPSLGLEPLICINGVFPTQGGSSSAGPYLGQIEYFAGTFVPAGWAACDGQILAISTNTALFSILGTTYGGNGTSNFALPDLQGRVAVGADSTHPLGSTFGEAATTLTSANLPQPAGSDMPVNNDQPSLALNDIIATSGVFPSQDGSGFNTSDPILGQVSLFAGNFAPSGWALCQG